MERIEKLRERLTSLCPELELRVGEPLSRYTSFRIGGPAALMALPKSAAQAAQAVKIAREMEIEPFFLGNGSNLLVPDEGYPGFVISLTGEFGQVREENGLLWAGAAMPLARLAAAAMERSLGGLEFASGIPGTLGGAVAMNAGAYGGEMAQVLTEVTFLDENGEERTVPVSECALGYRHSVFTDHPQWLILGAALHLEQKNREDIQARMKELAAQRQAKQPLEYPSAGSMFKRPEGHFAAALIDQCGLKGFTVGGAQVSEKHAGFVVNRGGATCADVLELVRQVKEKVLAQTGVELEMEVKILGGEG